MSKNIMKCVEIRQVSKTANCFKRDQRGRIKMRHWGFFRVVSFEKVI